MLTLKASGVNDVANFRWLEPPDAKALERAEQLLVDLGALDSNAITPLGRRMLAFPVHPRYARMLLAAEKYGCVRAIALIAALTQGRNLLRRAESKQVREDRDDLFGGESESDLFVLMRAFRFAQKNQFDPRRCGRLGVNAQAAREAEQLCDQFLNIAHGEDLKIESGESKPGAIQRCILAGFPDQVAVRLDKGTLRCAVVHNRHGLLARESAVHNAELIVASEIREIESSDKERQVLLTLATKIEEEWLRELFPEAFREETNVAFDAVQRRVVGRREVRFHDLTLQSETAGDVSTESAAAILAREVLNGNLTLKNWDNAVEQWIARVHSVANWFPELELSKIGEAEKLALLEQICLGAYSYREIKDRPVWPVVKSWLSSAQQQALDELAPERIKLPGGKSLKITYNESNPPTVAARIQDLYGVKKNLTIGRGKIPLRIQVLAPNHRPIQITDDLGIFWRETYPKIKKELQRKYPKHEWRDL